MAHQPMSMEAMLDEERRDVLALLEGNPIARSWNPGSPVMARSPSPYTSPRSPVRSMLDVGDDAASISSATGKKSPPQAIRSMLDLDTPPPPPQPTRSMLDIDSSTPVPSAPNSPAEPTFRTQSTSHIHPRSNSDSSQKPDFGPRSSVSAVGRIDPTAGYQFSDIFTSGSGQALPKRNTQAGKRLPGSGSMADVMRGNDLQGIVLPSDRGRHSIAGPPVRRGNNTSKSKSPHNRLGMRSHSPNVTGRFQPIPGTATLDDGRVVDISNAYRKLSDANLAFSGGSLSQLAQRKRSSMAESGNGRLAKDYLSPDGDELDDSSDDAHQSSSDEDRPRGRGVSPRSVDNNGPQPPGSESTNGGRKTLSLLAAAEEERLQIASKQPQYKYRSLLDEPEITVTGPTGEKGKPSKPGIHPVTSYDQGPHSGPTSVIDSDEEADLTDIKRAQKLAFSMTPIISTPDTHRAIRIIYRGEFSKIQQQAEEEHHRLRKYLVATDLSDESTHALEWAIGTVLRDGDTLMAIYCVDEETGIVTSEGSLVPDEPKAMKEQAAAINAVTAAKAPPVPANPTPVFPHLPRASALSFGGSTDSRKSQSPAPASRERTKAEEERHRAVEDITNRVTRLLRRTKLQVRVVVEVLHCKNPKHLITEIIDLVNPTLVILGSRGRSALKGVILGSFSNYLVTKSSVPVMVARKRLRKQNKYKGKDIKQVNNLSNPTARSLANAKID